jgi:hypothetical protein
MTTGFRTRGRSGWLATLAVAAALCGCASPTSVTNGGTGGQSGFSGSTGTGGGGGAGAATSSSGAGGSAKGGAGGSTSNIGGTGGSLPTGSGGASSSGGATGGGGSTGGNAGSGAGGSTALGGSTGTGGSAGATGGRGGSSAAGTSGTAGQSGAGGHGGSGGAGAGAGGTGGGTAGSSGASALLVPAQGALLGAFVGTGTLAGFEAELGRPVAINHNFVGWSPDWTPMLSTLSAGGRIPLVTWEAWDNGSVGAPLTDIIGGTYDSMITARAQAVKSFGQKFFLRWGHEMNGNWYPWDGANNGADLAATTTFISAYQHIHDLFVAAGATNALWVFCPNDVSVPSDSWNQWQNYYPGDAYVDWMGFDGYNWGTVQTTSTWQSFPTIVSQIYSTLTAKGKPIMIPETASTELGGDKAAWIAGILPSLKTMFPGIKALVWFQMNKETDWRIDSSSASEAAFVTMANDPYFNP